MSDKSIIENDVKEFLSEKRLKPIIESLDDDQINLLSNALFDVFSDLVKKHLTFKPFMSESVNSVMKALNTVMVNMKDKDLQSVLNDIIEELKAFIQDNDKRIYGIEVELNKQKRLIDEQKHLIDEQERVINEQKHTVNRLVMNLDNNEALCLANDLSDMYIHYMFEPKYSELIGKPETWSTFTDKICQREKELHEEQLTRIFERKPPIKDDEIEAEIAKLYSSIQKEFKVNLRDLRSLKRERTTMVHYRRRTKKEQEVLLKEARRVQMPSHFEYKHVFYSIIEELDASDGEFHRMPY